MNIYTFQLDAIFLEGRYDYKWKLWQTCQKRKFKDKPVKIYYFFFDSQLTGLIQNKTKYCNIKTHGVYSNSRWNYFQRGCMDKRRSVDFPIQTWCIPLQAFASKTPFDENLAEIYYMIFLFKKSYTGWKMI